MSKAITLRPYWAWAVCHAGKRIENRSWPTKYRGRLLIHAGKGNKKTDAADRAVLELLGIDAPPPEDLVRGAIVAKTELADCQPYTDDNEKTLGANLFPRDLNLENDPFACGPFRWSLEKVSVLEKPVPMIGKLSIFNVKEEIRGQGLEIRG